MKRFNIVLVIVTGIMFVALLSGCDFITLESNVRTIEQIEAFTGADLPADAQDVHYEVGGFQDTIIWLRFDASPNAVQQYLNELGFSEPLNSEVVSIQPDAPETADWWITEDLFENSDLIGGNSSNFDTNLHFQGLVDPTNPEQWRLYLIAFNT
jgi:hypothetical protein